MTTPASTLPAGTGAVPHEKYRLDPGDPITTQVVADRLARRVNNTVDPTLPGHLARAACVEVIRDLASLIRDLIDEANGHADLVEARQEAARRGEPDPSPHT